MEPEGSLPHSQEPATCPYPEPDQSSQCPPSHFLTIHFNIILPSTPGSTDYTILSLSFFSVIQYDTWLGSTEPSSVFAQKLHENSASIYSSWKWL
jgi:hypothetical protein